MKKIFYLSLLLLLSCCANSGSSNSSENNNDSIRKEFESVLDSAAKSPEVETKLFSDFEIGMSEQQFREVLLNMGKKGKLVHKDDIDTGYGQVFLEETFVPFEYRYEFDDNDDLYYIDFTPEYLDDKLVQLYCSVHPSKYIENQENLYKRFAEIFKESPRGKGFTEFVIPVDEKDVICFVKDNLCVTFAPYVDSNDFIFSYDNMPVISRLNKAREEKNEARKSYNDF